MLYFVEQTSFFGFKVLGSFAIRNCNSGTVSEIEFSFHLNKYCKRMKREGVGIA